MITFVPSSFFALFGAGSIARARICNWRFQEQRIQNAKHHLSLICVCCLHSVPAQQGLRMELRNGTLCGVRRRSRCNSIFLEWRHWEPAARVKYLIIIDYQLQPRLPRDESVYCVLKITAEPKLQKQGRMSVVSVEWSPPEGVA
jgi:hypothetical protein